MRAFRITLAAALAGITSIFSMRARKATRALDAAGARTCTVRPSSAAATPPPMERLMASTTRSAVPKSVSFSSRLSTPPSGWNGATARSTMAPLAMRPTASWLTCTLLPLADAPAPPTSILPCAMA
ncbi:hypothetical protein D3C72_1983390 [compost metagenome]